VKVSGVEGDGAGGGGGGGGPPSCILPLPEEGSRVSFRNVVFVKKLDDGQSPEEEGYVIEPLIIIIIIITIIWHYNTLWFFAFSAESLQVLLSLTVSFQFLTSSFFNSSLTSSCHHCLGLPTGLVPIVSQSSSFLAGLAWSIL